MSIIRESDWNNFKLEFSDMVELRTISEPINHIEDRYRVKDISELYSMVTTDSIFSVMSSEMSEKVETLDEIDFEGWDMYDYVCFIMGLEKYFNIDIDDGIAESFNLKRCINVLRRDEKLKNLGI